jgi:hypothetical protein
MTNRIKIIDQDIIFLSFDEPNAEKNYADLLKKVPWAKRVHGVKGSDAAHKACAAKSETEYFVTVDADNIVEPKFFQVVVDLDELGFDDSYVFSWQGRVHVNHLMYGNGGLKMWTRKFVNDMKTHENSDPTDHKGLVEFCFDHRYHQFDTNYSESYTNATPFQAWRAGFREGVKMSLDQGAKVTDMKKQVWWENYYRLITWCSVGRDVDNGLYSMLGAREGCYMTNCTDWDYANVRDFDYLTNFWKEHWTDKTVEYAEEKIKFYGQEINQQHGLEIADLDAQGSIYYKTMHSTLRKYFK